MFESLSPRREFSESAIVVQHLIQLSIVGWGKLYGQDPDQKVKPGLMEMMEKVVLDSTPAIGR
jgi:hypothetical protein